MPDALFAAAGIAEAAWKSTMVIMCGGMLVICIVGFQALVLASRNLATIAMVLLYAFTLFFQPWYCFIPFEAEAYDDPDVVAAAGDFFVVGIGWVLTTLFVFVSSTIAWRKSLKQTKLDSSRPTN